MNYSLSDIAKTIGGEYTGNNNLTVSGVSPLEAIDIGTIVMCMNKASLATAVKSNATAVILPQSLHTVEKPCIKVDKPKLALIKLLTLFAPKRPQTGTIHPSAMIEDNVSIGKNVTVGAYVSIGRNTSIGDNTVIKSHVSIGEEVSIAANVTIHPNVVLYDDTVLKDNVTIHASSVIGSDGFGYEFDGSQHLKLPHLGHVVIEKDVEIGANTVVDKATLGATHIGAGTKIDNLVQIAHNVKLGKNNILCAFTGIAGSTTTGNQVICAANVGIADHATIEDNVMLGPKTGVPANKRCSEGTVWLGTPARQAKQAIEQTTHLNRLPSLRKTVKDLVERVKQLETEKA